MKKNLQLKALAVAVMTLVGATSAMADAITSDIANVIIRANTDSSGGTENVFITSNNCATGCNGSSVAQNQATARFSTDGTAEIRSTATTIYGNSTAVLQAGNSLVQTNQSGQVYVRGAEGVLINAEADMTGSVYIGMGGNNTLTGSSNVISATGANGNTMTSVNGNFITGATNTITGTTNTVTGTTNTVTGTTNNITGTTNNITGITNINASNNAATNINTGNSNGIVTIGNALNVTNINSGTNNVGVGYASINNIGTGAAATSTSIGNTQTTTTVNATAGNASQSLANNVATTNVSGGSSTLTNPTVVASSQVRISNSGGATVDANGKLSSSGAGSNTTAGITVTNGYGNVNGVVATEQQASISGGTSPATASTLRMDDSGARFSNARTGAPVTVTGVADGSNDYDAVNVRQFAGAVAALAAQANVPALAAGQARTFGLGLGSFMGKTGLAVGMNVRGEDSATYKLTVSTGLNGGAQTVLGAGAAWSF